MRRIALSTCLCSLLSFASGVEALDLTASLKKGDPAPESAGPIAFGADGVLFFADPIGAAIYAIDTADRSGDPRSDLAVAELDTKVAALLGTTAKEIQIQDAAVNPGSGKVWLSVSRGRGPDAKPALVRVDPDGKLAHVALSGLKFARAELPDAPAPDAVDRRNTRLRLESITDIAFVDGRVLIAGLSNEEFASTLRSIPFPFDAAAKGTSVEIYHGAHGKFETRSPIRTFVSFDIAGEPHVLAAYTCTPLVRFPVKELEPGKHLKGTTIAELGNRNRPLDMISYSKDGKSFLLLANNARGIMKIPTAEFGTVDPILARVEQEKEGVAYETIDDWKGIHQLDKLSDTHAVVVRQGEDGALHLEARPLP